MLDAIWTNNDCCYHGYMVGLVNDVLLWKPYQGHKSMREGSCNMEVLAASVVSDVSMGFFYDILHCRPIEIIQWPTYSRCLMQYRRITIVVATVSPYGILTMNFIWNLLTDITALKTAEKLYWSAQKWCWMQYWRTNDCCYSCLHVLINDVLCTDHILDITAIETLCKCTGYAHKIRHQLKCEYLSHCISRWTKLNRLYVE